MAHPLEAPVLACYAKRNHCQGQLLIRRTENATYCEVVDGLVNKTHSIVEQLDELRRRQAVADLDAQWAIDRERYYIDSESGNVPPPTPNDMNERAGRMNLAFNLSFTALGVANFFALSEFSRGGFLVIPFDVFACVLLAYAYSSHGKLKILVNEFATAKAEYQAKRQQLTDQLVVRQVSDDITQADC